MISLSYQFSFRMLVLPLDEDCIAPELIAPNDLDSNLGVSHRR